MASPVLHEHGNDSLYGGIGTDILTGGRGSDRFCFSGKSEGIDRINDFSTVYDTINVSAKGFGAGLVSKSSLTVAQFYQGSAAHDSSDALFITPVMAHYILILMVQVRHL